MSTSSHRIFARNLDEFDPTCPENSAWYACPESGPSDFVGCCASDPCSSKNGCSQGNIRSVSYNASSHGTDAFPPDATCGTGSDFYTCVGGAPGDSNRPTFWGCCKSNPCLTEQKTCPEGDLLPAFMSTPSQFQAYTGEHENESSPSPTPSPSAAASSKTSHTAVIVGGTVGGVVLIVAIISVLVFCLCKRRKAKSRASTPVAPTETSAADREKATYTGASHDEAPPTYTSPNPNAHPAMFAPISGYEHHYEQVSQQPQELPAELASSGPSRSRYSELPADTKTAQRAEMESPAPSPKPPQSPFMSGAGSPRPAELESPRVTPKVPQATFGSAK